MNWTYLFLAWIKHTLFFQNELTLKNYLTKRHTYTIPYDQR
jgi:hypothetical protein